MDFKHLKRWERPAYYAGCTYEDYFLVAGLHRDSCLITQSNWHCWIKLLKELQIPDVKNPHFDPEADPQEKSRDGNSLNDETIPGWCVVRASHWAVGWVETLLLHSQVPREILLAVEAKLKELDGYPVFDESDLSNRQSEAFETNWANFGHDDFLRGISRKFELSDAAFELLGSEGAVFGLYRKLTDSIGSDDGDGNPLTREATERCSRDDVARLLWNLKYKLEPAARQV